MNTFYCKEEYSQCVDDIKEAAFLIQVSGNIIYCNPYGLEMFRYSTLEDICEHHVKDLVPNDFATHFPKEITPEHLTNNIFFERVNRRKDGTEFQSLVMTQSIEINNKSYIETRVRSRGDSLKELESAKLQQNVSLLTCELNAERNRMLKLLGKQKSEYWDDYLVSKLANKYKNLSNNDYRIASMIYHKMDSNDIAKIMDIEVNSIYTARKRLRKRMNLLKDVSILEAIMEIYNEN